MGRWLVAPPAGAPVISRHETEIPRPNSSTLGVRARPIIVLGPERTGTSLVAEMVHAWGAYAGEPHDLSPPDHRNQRGYWEYQPLWALAEQIGDFAAGVSWWEASF